MYIDSSIYCKSETHIFYKNGSLVLQFSIYRKMLPILKTIHITFNRLEVLLAKKEVNYAFPAVLAQTDRLDLPLVPEEMCGRMDAKKIGSSVWVMRECLTGTEAF